MDGDSPLYGTFIFILFIILNGVFYSFNEALKKLNYSEVDRLAEDGQRRSIKIKQILGKEEKFTSTMHIMTASACVVMGYFHIRTFGSDLMNLMVEKVGTIFSDEFILLISYLIITVYLLFLLISIGIIFPKNIGWKYSEKTVSLLYNIVLLVMWILTPFTAVTSFFAKIILRIFGIDPNETSLNVTEAEIISMVNEGHEQGVLEEREVEMISNIIGMDEKEASDIMIHRKHIVAIDGNWTLDETVKFILNESYSRFPVYDETIDDIIGVLHFRDAVSFYYLKEFGEKKIKDLDGILRKPEFIPETRKIDDIFRDMQVKKMHMIIIIDEYGQTSGLIAMEDILEEIVGNILDEYDEEENNIIMESENVYLMKGLTTLEEAEAVLGIEFDDEENDTLNGYLISKLDRIPDDNEKPELIIDNYNYKIILIKDKMISLVRITKLETKYPVDEEE